MTVARNVYQQVKQFMTYVHTCTKDYKIVHDYNWIKINQNLHKIRTFPGLVRYIPKYTPLTFVIVFLCHHLILMPFQTNRKVAQYKGFPNTFYSDSLIICRISFLHSHLPYINIEFSKNKDIPLHHHTMDNFLLILQIRKSTVPSWDPRPHSH